MKPELPAALGFLFEPHRYKGAHGGRAAGRSWSFARALLVKGAQRPLRILCARETMKSIADSVHALLRDQIAAMEFDNGSKFQSFYEVQQAAIYGKNGTEFIFAGLKHNITNIKSVESVDICWVEEAQAVTKQSWDTLIPTIRKEGSEIWLSWNDDLDTDDTHRRFVVSPPPSSRIVKLTFRDNPWFPEVLREEMEHLKAVDPVAYDNVWEGNCRSAVEGAIYGDELRRAELNGRICKVPYETTKNVDTFWDLGYGDMVSVWFAQSVGFEYRVIDYYENSRQAIDHYLQVLQQRGYTYGTCVLPWDGGAKSLGTGRSIEELMRAKGFRTRVLPQLRVADGINAVRTLFPQMYFDSDKCQEGIYRLRRYQWGKPTLNKDGIAISKREPLHDEHSHAADALRTLAVYIKPPASMKPNEPEKRIVQPPRMPGPYAPFS